MFKSKTEETKNTGDKKQDGIQLLQQITEHTMFVPQQQQHAKLI